MTRTLVPDKELALGQVLHRLLTEDQFQDITLQGTDGSQVRANKYILAARSTVFQQMLFGGFSEANSPVVQLGYDASVLQAVVEYIHTDSARMLRWKKGDGDQKFPISGLVSLSAAATYFHLPGLFWKVYEVFSQVVIQNPSFSFQFLAACRKEGPAVSANLSQLARNIVRHKARDDYLSADAVQVLNASVLEEILQDQDMRMTEAQLFNILCLWMAGNPSERKSTAQELFKRHIALEKMDPSFLSSIVDSSRLATAKELSEAIQQQQSLEDPQKVLDSCKQWRNNSWKAGAVWTNSVTEISSSRWVDLLICFPMTSGVYRWKLEQVEYGASMGIVNLGMPLDLTKGELLQQKSFWGFSSYGTLWSHGKNSFLGCKCLPPKKELVVTLTLDLRPGYGILSRSVGEGRKEILCSGLLTYLKQHPEGFVPAVATKLQQTNARVRLVGMEKLME